MNLETTSNNESTEGENEASEDSLQEKELTANITD